MFYNSCNNYFIFLGIAVPNRSGSEPSDVKKPVRYGNKKKQKQFQDKTEDTSADIQTEMAGIK